MHGSKSLITKKYHCPNSEKLLPKISTELSNSFGLGPGDRFPTSFAEMALGSSSFTSTRLTSVPSLRKTAIKTKNPLYLSTASFKLLSVQASATDSPPKARFVARRKESVSVRQLQRPLSNVRKKFRLVVLFELKFKIILMHLTMSKPKKNFNC